MKIIWKTEIATIEKLIFEGNTLEHIGEIYGVSKQRIYQVFTKFGIKTPIQKKKNFLRDKDSKYYWLNSILTRKGVLKADRRFLLETLKLPKSCPMLGIELNYDGTGREGWSRTDNSPSLDRINSSLGYVKGNLQVISWRANRIKNDGTPEELMRIATYMKDLTRNLLQV